METIKTLRKITGLSQEKFAKKYHTSPASIRNWEQGTRGTPEIILYLLERVIAKDYENEYKLFKQKKGVYVMGERQEMFNKLVSYDKNLLSTYMGEVEDFYTSRDVKFPVTLGVVKNCDEPIKRVKDFDLIDMQSMLIVGSPRSGKSVFVENLIAQLAAFNSPDDINFILFDLKSEISDFKSIQLPHIKKKVLDYSEFIFYKIDELSNKVLLKRIHQIADAGCLNIQDYNKRNTKKIPYTFVIIDEASLLLDNIDDTMSMNVINLILNGNSCGIIPVLISNSINLGDAFSKYDIIDKITYKVILSDDEELIKQVTHLDYFEFEDYKRGDFVLQYNDKVISLHNYPMWQDRTGRELIFRLIKNFWSVY